MQNKFIASFLILLMSIPALACDPTMPSGNSTIGNITILDFNSNVTTGVAPLHCNFSANVQGNVTSYLWVFGPESKDYYSKHFGSAVHTFTEPGVYAVTLQVCGPDGKAVMTKTNYINVTGKSQVCTPTVCKQSTSPVVDKKCGKTFTFSPGKLVKPGASYTFNFGDGSKSVVTKCMSVKHTYSKKGTFTVTCIAKSKCKIVKGCATVKVA